MPDTVLRVVRDGATARVTLQRPDVRNAFNAELIAELRAAFDHLGSDASVRSIVLDGAGKTFCGGADVNWMRGSLELSEAANVADAERMSQMYRAIDRCPKPVIGRIHGGALGGGAGLAAVCDIVLSTPETIYGFTETKLGIIPAVISPFVIAKIGVSHARALFLTGERFSAERAQAIGLVHEVLDDAALERRLNELIAEFATSGPSAVAAAKDLVHRVRAASYDASESLTAHAIARQRTSPEGQEGLRAFLERRPAMWHA